MEDLENKVEDLTKRAMNGNISSIINNGVDLKKRFIDTMEKNTDSRDDIHIKKNMEMEME